MRLGLLCFSFLFASGCYMTHDPGGGTRCGARSCTVDEVCCPGCGALDGFCQSPDLICAPPICPSDCSSSFDCDFDQYCEMPAGRCGGVGRCAPRPVACDGDCPGVCGCDGFDYCNECDAAGAGQSISSPSPCDTRPCDGTLCPLCFGDFECIPPGAPCPEIFCPADCVVNEECAPSDFCQFAAGECGPSSVPGACVPRPTGCTSDCPSVCGCDGDVYCNDCMANAAGVNPDPRGICVPPACGRGGRLCAMGEYCDLGPGCGASDGFSCMPLPGGCDDGFDPVCGCDGRTYSNRCEAQSAGMTVQSLGECPMVAASCLDIMLTTPGLGSGVYTIAPDGIAVSVFCDFETDGGGWTLVASTAGEPLNDAVGPHHEDLSTLNPRIRRPFIWGGMRGLTRFADVRFTCRDSSDRANRVDLSFYDVIWYAEWTTGSDADSCFSENDGAGYDRPAPARRNNISGEILPEGFDWEDSGYLEGEDTCDSEDDFTVDFRDRGMDSNERDGTDWGEDDNTPKCGASPVGRGIWQIWVREG